MINRNYFGLPDRIKQVEIERTKYDTNGKLSKEYIEYFLRDAIGKTPLSRTDGYKRIIAADYAGALSSEEELRAKAEVLFDIPKKSDPSGQQPIQRPTNKSYKHLEEDVKGNDMQTERHLIAKGQNIPVRQPKPGTLQYERWADFWQQKSYK